MLIQHSAQTPTAGTVTTGATEINVPLEPTPNHLPDYVFQALGLGPITFQAWNSGANTINCTVYGTNDNPTTTTAALWIDVSTTALDTLAASAASAKVYKETAPGFAFYKVMTGDAAGVGTAHVRIFQAGTL